LGAQENAQGVETRVSEIAKLMFRDRYGARERHLHEMVFYEGNIDVEDVRYELERVKAYLDDVGRALEMAQRPS